MPLLALLIWSAPLVHAQAACEDAFAKHCEERRDAADAFKPTVDSSDPGLKGASAAQSSMFTSLADAWKSVRDFCTKERERCQAACGSEERCNAKLNPTVFDAHQKMSAFQGQAAEANSVAATGDDQKSAFDRQLAEAGASVQKSRTVLDAVRAMGNCSQTGAGNTTTCIDGNGVRWEFPSGPGSAFQEANPTNLGPVPVKVPRPGEVYF